MRGVGVAAWGKTVSLPWRSGIRPAVLLACSVALCNTSCILLLLQEDEPSSSEPTAPAPTPSATSTSSFDPPPAVTRIVVPAWPPIGPLASVEITATDNRSLSRADVFFAKRSTRSLSGTASTFSVSGEVLGEGFGELLVQVTDSSGGTAERRFSNLLVDLTPPTIQLLETTVPATGERAHIDMWITDAWVLGDVTLQFGDKYLRHDFVDAYPPTLGKQWDTSLVSFEASAFPPGRGTARVVANDGAGNSAEKSFYLHIDAIAPAVQITAPAADSVVTGRFDVTVEASDALGGNVWVELSVAGTTLATSVGSATLTLDANELPIGSATINAVAIDEAGNRSAPASVTVNVTR
jgi:hypothetical protein